MSAIGERHASVVRDAPRASVAVLLGAWLPVALWLAFIFSLSSDRFSDAHTAAWLSGILGALGFSPAVLHTANLIVRKSAHLVEYAVLGLLLLRATRATWRRREDRQMLGIAMAAAVLCAAADEMRQYVLSWSRTGSLRDVLVDSAGALLGASLLYRRSRRRAPRRRDAP